MLATPPKATGVVIHHSRPQNIDTVVYGMLDCEWVDSVIVWNNSGRPSRELCHRLRDSMSADMRLRGKTVGVAESPSEANIYTMGRFKATQLAETDLIITCDDDCLVTDWDTIYHRHIETGRLVSYLDPSHMAYAKTHYVHRHDGGTAYETLLGWGSIFRREWVSVLDRYHTAFGDDEVFYRKADRLFTILLDQPHELIECDVRHLPGATSEDALYKRKDHWRMNKEAARRAVEVLNAHPV